MNEFKVTFSDGDFLYTKMNATLDEAKAYYIEKVFYLLEEHPVLVVSVQQI